MRRDAAQDVQHSHIIQDKDRPAVRIVLEPYEDNWLAPASTDDK